MTRSVVLKWPGPEKHEDWRDGAVVEEEDIYVDCWYCEMRRC
jgi:hypothetical protein